MKRIVINAGKVGLVFRKGDYKRVITEGSHWVSLFERVAIYSRSNPFHSPIDLNILLKDEKLMDMLHLVEVADNEIVLQYENNNFKGVLTAGRYTFWKDVIDYAFVKVDLSKIDIIQDIDAMTLKRRELMPYIRSYRVESYEKGILFVDGKFERVMGSGEYNFWRSSMSVEVSKVDMRFRQLEIAGQEILTKDKAALRINFVGNYQVLDVEKALIHNKDYEKQLYTWGQLALREFVGTLTLDELLEKKDEISEYVLNALKERVKVLGVQLNDCGVRDIILPGEVKDIMNQVLIAQKQAQANVVMRREETASTRSLLNTAKLMEDNEMLFKLKEMEYVEKIADKIGEITVAGNGQVIDQLKAIFTPGK